MLKQKCSKPKYKEYKTKRDLKIKKIIYDDVKAWEEWTQRDDKRMMK